MGMGVNGVWVGGGIPGGIVKEGIRRYELPKSQDISIRLRCTGYNGLAEVFLLADNSGV